MTLALPSCLNNEESNVELSSNTSITAFSIEGNINTYYTEKTSAGKDTTITVTISGNNYPFVINQNSRLIYNVDSLPVGTNIKKVVVSISADSQYILIVNQEDNTKDSLWTSTDSLNFENPIKFKVVSQSGAYGPIYTAKINVHKQEPDSLTWSQVKGNFSGASITKQKAVTFSNRIYVFGLMNGKTISTYTSMNDGKTWSTPTEVVVQNADYSSVMVWGNEIYILADKTLYKSTDAVNWSKVTNAPSLTRMVANYHLSDTNAKLWAINSDNKFVYTANGTTWTIGESVNSNFPTKNLSYAFYSLSHNSSLNRMVVMGNNPSLTTDSTSTVWSNLNTENKWVAYPFNNNLKYCPNFANITMIYYNSNLYAFGGECDNIEKPLTPFKKFYVSTNGGANWKAINSKIMFPSTFAALYGEAEGNYSCTVDSNNYIWIMWSKTGGVWKGIINKLGFDK